jgi:LysR family hydrogen peroxide-inducible transcriptional activator
MKRVVRLRDLEYLLAVADRRNFSRAAEACGVSQPTLSTQIRRLEDALAMTIFDRTGRRVGLTPEGAQAVEEARRVMAALERLERVANGQGAFFGRRLRFGAIPTIAPYVCPGLLGDLEEANAKGGIEFVEDLTESLEEQVRLGGLDFAIVATLPKSTGVGAVPLATERLCLVSRDPFPAGEPPTTWARPILLMCEGHCFREHVHQLLLPRGRTAAEPQFKIAASSFSTLLELVRAGYGDTVLPEPFVRRHAPLMHPLHTVRLRSAQGRRGITLIVRRGRERHADVKAIRRLAKKVWEAADAGFGIRPPASSVPGDAAVAGHANGAGRDRPPAPATESAARRRPA